MCRLFLMTISFLMILFGAVILWMMPGMIQQKIEERIQLKIGTKNYERFTKIPIPLTVKFYLFNITNSERVLAGLERPHFQEVGPFVYKQWRRREVVDIIDNNRKITYKEFKTFYLESKPELTSNVTLINVPLLAVLTQLAQLESDSLKRKLAAKVVGRLISTGQEKILVSRRAEEFLFDGYKVAIMEAAHDLVSNTLGFNFESPLPRNKFGFFHLKNNSWSRRENGEMTVVTGRNNSMNDFMLVDNWNGLKQLDVWPKTTEAGNRCNEIRGTDGSQFHPGVTRDQTLDIFSPLVCTSIYIKYKEDTQARGIQLLRFTTPPEVFGAPKKVPQNACYCTISTPIDSQRAQSLLSSSPSATSGSATTSRAQMAPVKRGSKITNDRCYIDGLMDLSLCQKGAPIAASAPHFFNGEPLLAQAAGLEPRRELHETYLDIEPMTGAVMRAASRAQLNAFVEQAALDVVDPQLIGHMRPMVAPLLWLEEAAEIDEKSAREFKGQLLNTVTKLRRFCYYAIGAGLVIALLVSLQYWYVACYKIDLDAVASKSKEARRSSDDPLGKSKRQQRLEAKRRRHEQALRHYNPRGGANYETNLRLGLAGGGGDDARTGCDARGSNLAAAAAHLDDCGADEELLGPRTTSRRGAKVPVIAMAAVLGAADARQRALKREQRRNRRADYELDDEATPDHGTTNAGDHDNDADEEELMRRNLVESEWALGEATQSSTSGQSDGCGDAQGGETNPHLELSSQSSDNR